MSTVKDDAVTVVPHITYGSVFDDLGFSPEKAASLKLKAELHREIIKKAEKHTQAELQQILDETQSRVSLLMTGKISGFSLDKLVFYAECLGLHPRLRFARSA